MHPDNKGRTSLVSIITTPLGFFALSLLIVEGFLGIILIGSSFSNNSNQLDNLSGHQKFIGLWIGAALFVVVVGIVAWLVWNKPTHLTFSGGEHLQHDKDQMTLGDQDTKLTKVEAKTKTSAVSSVSAKGKGE